MKVTVLEAIALTMAVGVRAALAQANPPTCEVKASINEVHEPWSDHFTVFERTRDGARLRLSKDIVLVDAASEIVLERSTAEPEVVLPRSGKRTLPQEVTQATAVTLSPAPEGTDDGFDVDLVRYRVESATLCPTPLAFDGLQYEDVYRGYRWPYPRCPERAAILNWSTPIKKGATFVVPRHRLAAGDRVDIQLRGRELGDRMTVKSCTPTGGPEHWCVERQRTLGDPTSFSAVIVPFAELAPFELVGSTKRPIPTTRSRVDAGNDIVVDFEDPIDVRLTFTHDRAAQADILVEAKVTSASGERRPFELTPDRGRPRLTGLRAGDQVELTISRRVHTDTALDWRFVSVHHFQVAALGLHYAPTGERRAHYSTSSAVLVSLGDQKRAGFSQTLAYSLHVETREPSFVEHLGLGFHFALLASDQDTNRGAFSLGLGGQITFGRDVLQLGAGYDLLREEPYLVFGLSLPDLATLLDKVK